MFNPINKPNEDQIKNFIRFLSEYVKRPESVKIPINDYRINGLNLISDCKPKHKISLDEFVQQVCIALSDIFCGIVFLENEHTLCLHFSDNDVFRIKITRL